MEENNISEDHLNIYPNPTSSTIIIETSIKGHFSILNLNGQELLKLEINTPFTQIDISALPRGVCVVKVVGEKGVQMGKFVKQ